MKYRYVIATLVFIGLGGGIVIGMSSEDEAVIPDRVLSQFADGQVASGRIPDNNPAVIQNAIERQDLDSVIVLDVRTDEEWNESHAVGAVHWGLVEKLEQGEMLPYPLDTELYIYCRSGNRSGQAIQILEEAGFTDLTNIGGLNDWVEAGGQST